ncbi:M55 family metallopeptidase [Terrarubrum flagellatum]|uniref:M55 family metallopeptidase n=1 Tax=Terrirubrum flagellatum TaxID=2895980 RepID=UPI003144E81A
MRIYISADIEGIAGVVTREHTRPEGFEYQSARVWMTDSVAAAANAAFESGATEVVISDSHGNMQNLLLDRLPPQVQVVRASPRPLSMMQGMEVGDYAGALFIGYHAGATNPGGILAHTFRSVSLREVRVNGVSVPEAGINAAIAGHFGTPVLLVSGDDVCIDETRAFLPDIEAVTVKWAHSRLSARTITPTASYELISAGVKKAIDRRASIKPYVIPSPITLDVNYLYRQPVEYIALLKGVERLDAFTIRYIADDILDLQRFMVFALGYNATLQ